MAETRGISWWAAALGLGSLAALIGAIAGLFIFFQTQTGLSFLAERIGRALSDGTMTVHASGLTGSILSSFSVGKITVGDRAGTYAVVDDTRVEWRPTALFNRTVHIESVSIGKIAVSRLPQTEAGSGSGPASMQDFASGFTIKAGKIGIGEIDLAQPVLGEAQRLSATATASLNGDMSGAALDLVLRRVDGGRDRAEMRLDYAAHPARFAALVRIEEPAGGVLARLAGLPRGDRLSIDLSGDGPPENWKGTLKFASGSALAMRTGISLVLHDATIGVSLDGTASIESLLPSRVRLLAAPRVRFRGSADVVPAEGIIVRKFTAESDLLDMSGNGGYRFADGGISAAISSRLRDHPSAAALLPEIAVSQASADVKLDGTLDAPRFGAQIQTGTVAAGPARVASTQVSIQATPSSSNAFDLKGTMKAAGVNPGTAVPAGVLGPLLDLTFAGKLGPDGSLGDAMFSAVSGPTKASLSGRLDANGLATGSYSLQLEQIESLTRSADLALTGRAGAEGRFSVDVTKGSASVTTGGSLADLATPSSGIAALLGTRVPFTGTIDWHEGKPMRLAGVKVGPAIGPIEADGTLDAATGALSATLRAAVSDLSKLSTVAGAGLGGGATISATLEGPVGALTARGDVQFTRFHMEDVALGAPRVGYKGKFEDASVKAELSLGGDLGGKTLKGGLNGVFGNGTIDLSGIDIAVGKNRLSGKLALDPARRRLAGDMKAVLTDIRDLPGAGQLGFSGAGEIHAMAGERRDTDIELTVAARHIRIGSGGSDDATIARATARFRLRSPFADVSAAGDIDLENVQVAGLRHGKAQIGIKGTLSNVEWSASAGAEDTLPISLSAQGTLSSSPARSRLAVEKLEGSFAGQAIASKEPFAVTWRGEKEWRVGPVDLSLAGGSLRMDGSLAGGVLDANGRFDDLPLRLGSLIDSYFQMEGSIAGKFRATGSPASPVLTLSLAGQKIRPPEMTSEEFAGFNLAMDIRQDSAATRATGKLTGPQQTSATLALQTLPLIGLAPFSLALEPGLAISGDLAWNGQLGLVDALFGLGDNRVAGVVSAKANITGTLGKPVVRGDARLSGGSYEGAELGTVLRKVEGHVIFSGDSARLVSLSANDGATGRLSGSGQVQFGGAGVTSGGIEVKLDRFTALRHPLVEAVVTGPLTLSGTLDAPRLSGGLRVEKAQINIPEQLPQEIVELDVVEINGEPGNGATATGSKEPSLSKAFPVSLDLTLDFPTRTFVRGRGLDSEWKGKLALSGTTDAPVIDGKLDVVRGTFAFAGKTFVVKSGSVTFPKSASDPEIQATAEAALKDLVAKVELSGNISKPTIKISSDPALPQEDVLAHILFGRTTGQLSALQAAQLAQTAATLSGKTGTGIVDKVRQTLGVDVLNVESGEDKSKGASLKAGKYLTDDVFLSVTQGTKPGSQKVGVEVQVLPNISVESDVSGTADGNIGLNWKWDY